MAGKIPALWLALLVPGSVALGADDDGRLVFREEGRATVYADKFQGRRTASGARFDQGRPMAAHPELPLGSKATVTDPGTGRKVEVEVVDRGPYAGDHDIDLSKSAAKRLGIAEAVREEGSAAVRIEASEGQVEAAIDGPAKVGRVERRRRAAREAAAREGTPQPEVRLDLEAPREQGVRR